MCAHKNRKVRVIMNTQQIIETAEEKLIHTYNRYQIVLDKGDGVRLTIQMVKNILILEQV